MLLLPDSLADEGERLEDDDMPLYDFLSKKCSKTFELTMSIKEREKGKAVCPKCESKKAESLLTSFFAKTSKKS